VVVNDGTGETIGQAPENCALVYPSGGNMAELLYGWRDWSSPISHVLDNL